MSDVENFIETTNRLVYTVPDPTTWGQVSLAMELIRQDLRARGINTAWDDTVTVASDGEKIRFMADLPDGQHPSFRPSTACDLGPCALVRGHAGGCRT